MYFILGMQSWNFSSHYSLVSHDSAEIILIFWFGAQETSLLLSMLKMKMLKMLLNIFVETVIQVFLSGSFDEYKIQKNSIYLD